MYKLLNCEKMREFLKFFLFLNADNLKLMKKLIQLEKFNTNIYTYTLTITLTNKRARARFHI